MSRLRVAFLLRLPAGYHRGMDALIDFVATIVEIIFSIVFYAIFRTYWLLCWLFAFIMERLVNTREKARQSPGGSTHGGESQISD